MAEPEPALALPGVRPPPDPQLYARAEPDADTDVAGAGPPVPGASEGGRRGSTGAAEGAWRLAPVRWGGVAGLEWRSSSFDGAGKRRQVVEFANLRLSSYVWQPWFAQVNALMSFSGAQVHAGTGDSRSGLAATGSDSRSITGSAGLAMFPQSRFPFNASYSLADSRSSDIFTASESRTQRLSLRQAYRSVDGNEQYGATFDRSVLSSSTFGSDRVDVAQGTWTRRLQDHQFDASATHTQNVRSSDDGGSRATRLSLAHTFRRDEDFIVASNLSDSTSRAMSRLPGATLTARTAFRQLSTLATWTPDLERPLLVTGAFRWADTSTALDGGEGDGGRSDTRTMSATGAATWRPTDRLSVGAAATMSQFASGGVNQTVSAESLSGAYTFDPIALASFNYVSAITAGVAHQAGGLAGRRMQSTAGVAHSVLGNTPLTPQTSLGSSIGQTLHWREDSTFGATGTITHNAAVNVRHMADNGMSAFGGLSVGDSRIHGFGSGMFQMINLQMSGQMPFGRYASASANATIQKTRQASGADPDASWRTYSSGGASFQHSRAFGVQRLRYTALATVFNSQINARISGDLNAPRENVAWMHEQRLDYTLGRLDFRVSLRIAEVDGKKNALLFFRVTRSFGAF